MKAHDFAFASGCRACHYAIDQGKELSDALREHYWLRGHVETMRQLWERGLLAVNARGYSDPAGTLLYEAGREAIKKLDREIMQSAKARRRKSRTTRPDKIIPRGARIV